MISCLCILNFCNPSHDSNTISFPYCVGGGPHCTIRTAYGKSSRMSMSWSMPTAKMLRYDSNQSINQSNLGNNGGRRRPLSVDSSSPRVNRTQQTLSHRVSPRTCRSTSTSTMDKRQCAHDCRTCSTWYC